MFSFRIRCLNLCSNFCWLWVINFSLALLLKTRHFISGRSAFRYSDQRYIFPPMGHCVQSNQLKDTLWFPNAYSNLAKQRIKIRLAQQNRSFVSKYYMPATTLADLKITNHSQQLLVVRLEPATKRDVWLYHMVPVHTSTSLSSSGRHKQGSGSGAGRFAGRWSRSSD